MLSTFEVLGWLMITMGGMALAAAAAFAWPNYKNLNKRRRADRRRRERRSNKWRIL